MKWQSPSTLSLVIFAGVVCAEVLDFGDLQQYDPKLDALPDGIQADSIWITEADDGFNVVLGQDIKARVDGVLDGCGQPSDQCYQDVSKVLEDAVIQTDKHLQSRQLVVIIAFIARVWKSISRLKGAIAALTVAGWLGGKQRANDKGNFWPEVAASGAVNIPQATPITVLAGGSAVVTITQAPDTSTSLEGSVTPAVTAVTSAADGFQAGDLAAILDKGLADRLNDFMQRSKDCQAGLDFDNENPTPASTRKRAGRGTYGQALCASQAVIGGVENGGPFNDLLHISPAGVHFQFAPGAGPAVLAADRFADFIDSYSPMITSDSDVRQQLGLYIMALAIDTIVEDNPLRDRNRIQATMVITEGGLSPTASACPDPHSGEHKGCECTGPPFLTTDFADPGLRQDFRLWKKLLNENDTTQPPEMRPQCPVAMTEIPASVFSSDKNTIHSHFCEKWNKDFKLSMTVDSKGANVLPEPHLKSVTKRTPPADAGSYVNFRCDLNFTPASKDTTPGIYMYETGSYDDICGTFEYKIYNPFTKLQEFPRFCYKPEDVPALNGDVHGDSVSSFTMWPCVGRWLPRYTIRKDDKSSFVQNLSWDGQVPYQYNIWWKDGCALENNGPKAVYAADPLLQGEGAGNVKCQDTLWWNWKGCINGGIGGNVQLGCLMFEFVASDKLRVFEVDKIGEPF
ncbi:hypothetical protein QBC47DRAFT_333896 [Echria macrotheca]|uniref:Uncharacterized protein n=1 Tax=Echria macrotheca TaxID=438768 RepID=A0AAJ0BQ79_9PEZI|nr:hypothetical protein QBC47DRAFT_333896 [Echria macrotheca]